MTDVEVQPETTSPTTTPKKDAAAASKKAKNPKSKPTHPPIAEMVNSAIGSLKERGGSSLQAIKKYMNATYKVDADKSATYIKKHLKTAVASGVLVQTKGKGAAGSFKLPTPGDKKVGKAVTKKSPRRKKTAAVTAAAKKKTVASPTKKAAATPKTKGAKKAAIEKKPSARVAKAKSSSKANKVTKGPTKKPKAPKPKTTKAGRKAASPKKK